MFQNHDEYLKNPLVCLGCYSSEFLLVQMWVNPKKATVDLDQELPWSPYQDPADSGVSGYYCTDCDLDCGVCCESELPAILRGKLEELEPEATALAEKTHKAQADLLELMRKQRSLEEALNRLVARREVAAENVDG